MSRSRKRGTEMGSGKCTMTGLGREDGIVQIVLLHKTRRHIHQLASDAISSMLSARCTDGGVRLQKNTVLIRCGAPLSANQTCSTWIGISRFEKLGKHNNEIADLLQKLWFRANERANKVSYCPKAACDGSSGFILDDVTIKNVMCPICKERWCRDCNEDHSGICGVNADTDLQRCPDCGMGSYKDIGCDHMQCSCGCYFCYVCGMRITNKYNFHVRYSPDHGTYVCPQRINSNNKKQIPEIRLDPSNQIYNDIFERDVIQESNESIIPTKQIEETYYDNDSYIINNQNVYRN